MKRLSIFLDGTWNDEGSHTNVYELAERVALTGADGVQQLKPYYDPGVGTKRLEKLRGGALGMGLSKNVRDAYSWLLKEYEDGDEVYIFGFSRGAYTARSLGGLIAGCGLAQRNAPFDVDYLYQRYQHRKGEAAPIYELDYLRKSPTPSRQLTEEENRLLDHSRRIPIRMMGVWDTVGALGVPWTGMPLLGRDKFYFHNPNLSKIYDNAFQALAIDEHRGAYKPTLWTLFVPDPKPGEQLTPPKMPPREKVEQRWFIGAHADVGGGYQNDPLALPPCAWLQSKAQTLGLNFTQRIVLTGTEHQTSPHDSYASFMFHVYRMLTLGRRYYRPIGAPARKVKGGWSYPVNESVDASVLARYQYAKNYRPKNLEDWAQKKGIGLLGLTGDRVV
jgi:uncharacterized protein (DUF2235 family)